MAKLVSCRACGAQVSKSAKACPSCGEPTKKQAGCGQQLGGCLLLCLLMGGCVVVVGQWASKIELPEPTPWEQRDDTGRAYVEAIEAIRLRLKAPATAEFPGALMDGALDHVRREGQRYTVDSYVDSENSFGAKIRTRYRAVVEQIGPGQWSVLEADLLE